MPIPFNADRGEDLLVPKLPVVLRTCGGPEVVVVVVVAVPLFLDGDMEGEDRLVLLALNALIAPPLPLPLPPRRIGDRPLPVP